MTFFDRIHFNQDAYGEGIYFDIHIPKRFDEKLYFLFSVLPFCLRVELPQFLLWVNKDEWMLFG